MKILLLGDIIGSPGRKAVAACLPGLREEEGLDLVVANVENLAGGFGVTRETLQELKDTGVDAFTSGNHIWDKKEVAPLWSEFPTLVRPANYPTGVDGRGWALVETTGGERAAVLNLQGRVFMPPGDDPFTAAEREIEAIRAGGVNTIIIDIHAEATSEKVALAKYLDGRVSVVAGTHTHVATADARVEPGGTAAITDLGMVGSGDSVIGMKKEDVFKKFLTGLPVRYQVAKDDLHFWAALVETDSGSGKALSVKSIHLQP